MHTLILLIAILVVVGLVIFAVDRSPIAQPWKWVIEALVALVAALFVLAQIGLWPAGA